MLRRPIATIPADSETGPTRPVADLEIVDADARRSRERFVQRGKDPPRLVRLDDHARRVEHRRRRSQPIERVRAAQDGFGRQSPGRAPSTTLHRRVRRACRLDPLVLSSADCRVDLRFPTPRPETTRHATRDERRICSRNTRSCRNTRMTSTPLSEISTRRSCDVRILFADDDPGMRALVVMNLEAEGFEVTTVDGRRRRARGSRAAAARPDRARRDDAGPRRLRGAPGAAQQPGRGRDPGRAAHREGDRRRRVGGLEGGRRLLHDEAVQARRPRPLRAPRPRNDADDGAPLRRPRSRSASDSPRARRWS